MNKKLSQIALFLMVLTNINPVMAASKTPNADLSTQKLDAVESPNNIIVAQFWRDIQRTVKTVNEVKNTVDAITNPRNNRHQIRNVQRPTAEEREKIRAIRAEERKQYLESLSPEERSAFLQREQELKQKQAELLLNVLGTVMMSGDGGGSQSNSQEETWYHERNSSPTYNSSPAQVAPVHPNYGTCHHYSC